MLDITRGGYKRICKTETLLQYYYVLSWHMQLLLADLKYVCGNVIACSEVKLRHGLYLTTKGSPLHDRLMDIETESNQVVVFHNLSDSRQQRVEKIEIQIRSKLLKAWKMELPLSFLPSLE